MYLPSILSVREIRPGGELIGWMTITPQGSHYVSAISDAVPSEPPVVDFSGPACGGISAGCPGCRYCVAFGDGKTVSQKTDEELADLLKYWGHSRHPQYVADAIRAEIARRSERGSLPLSLLVVSLVPLLFVLIVLLPALSALRVAGGAL